MQRKSEWICHVRPRIVTGPAASAIAPTIPMYEQDDARARSTASSWAVQPHEPHVPPGASQAVQLRLAHARVVVDRDLAHAELAAERLEDHLRRELHARGVEVERLEGVALHCAHAAVRVRDLHPEEDVQHPREDRVPDVAVEPRHRLAVDRSLEPRAHRRGRYRRRAARRRALARASGTSRRRRPSRRSRHAQRRVPPGTRCRSLAAPHGRRSRRARRRPRRTGWSTRCRPRSPRPRPESRIPCQA